MLALPTLALEPNAKVLLTSMPILVSALVRLVLEALDRLPVEALVGLLLEPLDRLPLAALVVLLLEPLDRHPLAALDHLPLAALHLPLAALESLSLAPLVGLLLVAVLEIMGKEDLKEMAQKAEKSTELLAVRETRPLLQPKQLR